MAEVNYYIDVYTPTGDWTDEANIFDGNENTFGYTDQKGKKAQGDETTCPGTDLGTISAVDLRVLASGDGDDYLEFEDASAILGTLTPAISKSWTGYLSLPSRWHSWATIQDFSADALVKQLYITYDKTAKANQLNLYKVDIRVTYTEVGAKVTQYLPGHDCPEFPHEMDFMSDKLPCPPPYE